MKQALLIPFLVVLFSCNEAKSPKNMLHNSGETWTVEQLDKANTAKGILFLSDLEQEAILYINLARMFPRDFAAIELENYFGPSEFGDYLADSEYKISLGDRLGSMKAVDALQFDKVLYYNAKCFSQEQGDEGAVGHDRKICQKEDYAECCSYGMPLGKDVAIQWLIDHDVLSLGHRSICLDGAYSRIGLSEHVHIKFKTCTIAEFN